MQIAWAFLFILVSSLVIAPGLQAHGESYKGRMIGIVIEKTALMSGKIHYKDIIPLDSSNKKISGDFVKVGDDLRRANSPYKKTFEYYRFSSDYIIFVDPPAHTRDKLPLITIVSNLDEFRLKGQYDLIELGKPYNTKDSKATQQGRPFSHTRYVDSTCTNAIITAKNWQAVLPDTINFMREGCSPNATGLKTLSVEIKPLTKHNYGDSYKAKLDSWIKKIKQECLTKYQACKEMEQP